ncbi:MAG: AMP-binding protein [Acidobacteriota bacterium]|nr:AMP-binding protein [Acidobacteriota bacterium]
MENFRRRGPETAFVCRRGYRTVRWSYGQVADAASRLSVELKKRGVAHGDRILLWGDDCAEWVVSFFASVLCGAVVIPMDRTAAPEFVQRVCHQTQPKLRICSQAQSRADLSLPAVVFESLPDILECGKAIPPVLPDLKSDDAVEIVFTSGTTADPKGVVLSHKNILANLNPLEREIAKYIKYERVVHPLRFLNLLPLSHVFGQFLGIFIPQALGSTVLFQDTLNPSEILHTIKRESVSVLVTVPRVMETLRNKIERDLESAGELKKFNAEFQEADGESVIRRWWRFRRIHRRFGWKFWAFISGGATLPAQTEQFWGRLGFAVIQGYGLTETTSMISINHPFRLGKGSIGKILPGREVRLSSEGEILVRGESIAKSYYQGQEVAPVSGDEGWFHTGDLGALDKDGNLYFKGRLKNVIVTTEGMNIYPEDLEDALRRQPEIRDCVVLEADPTGNPEACAVLILRDPNTRPDGVIEQANRSLAEYQRIRRWLVWPDNDFPRTPTQKPQTKRIQEFINAHFKGSPSEKAGGETLADLIARITGREVQASRSESRLSEDLSLSSIERVELLSALEDRYQLDLNESRFTAASTLGDLEKMLRQPAEQRTDFHYPRWARNSLLGAVRVFIYYLLSYPAMMLMALPRIRGRENLRHLRGPVLFIANHVTQVDIGFIMAALPLRYRHRLAVAMLGELLHSMRHPPADMPLLKRWMEKVSYGLVVALFNVFPLPQRTGFRESFAYAGESVDRGYSILVFPEGKRTQNGELSPFQAGIGILATHLNIPVVPIRIDGLFDLKKAGKKFSRPGSVTVSIGSAIRYAAEEEPSKIARDLEARMRQL